MCREMSHSIPNSAVISETTMIPAGIAAHAGRPGHALAEPAEPREHLHPPRAVAEPEPQQHDGDDQRGARGDRDLVQRGATRGFRGEQGEHAERNVSSFDVTLCDVTPEAISSARVLTIDELARETGLTVRNVRSHHARGLLPPPEVRGRTGYYGPEHVERLKLIRRLQAEGLKLEGIKRLLGDSGERLLALKRAAEEPAETPQIVPAAELIERLELGEPSDARAQARRARPRSSGSSSPLGDGNVEVTSPALLAAAEEVVRRGVTLAPRARP